MVIEMDYYKNIQNLIEKDIVLKKKHKLIENDFTLKTYYEIGKNIVEAQGGKKHAKYGNNLINKWSKGLTEQYGKGYDASNLRRMRQLYLTFENCGTLSHNLSWSHYYSLLSIKVESKRNYYINISIKQNLSVRQLREKIKDNEYERLEYKGEIKLITDKNSTNY